MDMETKEGMKEYIGMVCKQNNWIVNTDEETFEDLVDGLVENKKNYGYQSCPCRLAAGNRDLDRDLICPCDYAPPDIEEFKTCYCNLYMDPAFYESNEIYVLVPERRPEDKDKALMDYIKEQE
jgi:ferredoxin-thioredoxin reductase catalytic subunit